MKQKRLAVFLIFIVFLGFCITTGAAPTIPIVTATTEPNGSETYSVGLQILLLMTALTLLPAFLLMMTSFTRILIVLGILRQALGMPTVPTNQILIGLSLFLTIFIMSPVWMKINQQAIQPYFADEINVQTALEKAQKPIRNFMIEQTREADLKLFVEMSGTQANQLSEIPLTIIMPAFITSELKTAFQIGFMIFLPFLVIDLVVASVLMGMGMMMLSPLIISLPFKIMLFVLVDGWMLILGTLASSFRI
ncbi:flagellar type III secretion system pore protein FliP [Piscirickettsia salmonis]|uniref:Flagellar biosynthetic protein FliP n=1 Tax=Piscirickettsia salmonis TaxID=1238 RepID=A0A9Q5VJW3_PISSA|nr:flagellar type III secretion system pore protein FliP [Piscirickettsia salmonis]ALA24890.1 flagellar biosynthetic protein FliP [Piscirickettsia salmonis]PEQ16715.1 flagellar biosynthetic protein FliP [Piscirickettsia salmonis]QGN77450.1 Flagellar biosynthetic protein FliP precursor [Piscirickettsia salmonis]QGN81038.1 Flagellar biosynthetic protein FliP precursor [Piscirickettsia salmonis]QGN84689.1 Flagellar biosynthetic protein FliP precursor [Piscirickettsia salmonis]